MPRTRIVCCCAQAEKIGTDATTAAAARRVIASIALLQKLVRAPAKRARTWLIRLAGATFQAHIGGARPRPTLTAGACSDPSGCLVALKMMIWAPSLSSLLSPGA